MKVMKSHGAIAACLEAWPQCRHCPAARPVSCSRSTLPSHPSCSMDNKTNQSEALARQRCSETPAHTVYHLDSLSFFSMFFSSTSYAAATSFSLTSYSLSPSLHFNCLSILFTPPFLPSVFLSCGFHWVLLDNIKKMKKWLSYIVQ